MELPSGTILGPYESREDWLLARKLGLGGSDIGAILGMSTYTSPLEVFYSKTLDQPEREVSEWASIGRDIEPFIVDQWIARERVIEGVYTDLIAIQSQTFPFLLHSPDFLVVDGGEVLAGGEVKNVRSDAGWDPIPPFYAAQVQHGLLCSGLDRWVVVALVAGQKLITREVEPDRELQGRIALEGERFWLDHVLANVPPEPDGSESSRRALERRWEASQDSVAEVTEEDWLAIKNLTERRDRAEKDLAKAKQTVMAKMGDKEIARTPDGRKVATWKVSTRTAVDTKRLKEEAPEIAKKFSTTTPTRMFRPNL